MIDEKKLRIETVNEYCIIDGKNQIIKAGFCSEEEAAEWLEEVYGVKHDPKPQPKTCGWISCSDRMPEEHDSIFAKFKGAEEWDSAMFEKISDDVNVTVEFENGKRKTKTLHTIDGKWSEGNRGVKFKVIA